MYQVENPLSAVAVEAVPDGDDERRACPVVAWVVLLLPSRILPRISLDFRDLMNDAAAADA